MYSVCTVVTDVHVCTVVTDVLMYNVFTGVTDVQCVYWCD